MKQLNWHEMEWQTWKETTKNFLLLLGLQGHRHIKPLWNEFISPICNITQQARDTLWGKHSIFLRASWLCLVSPECLLRGRRSQIQEPGLWPKDPGAPLASRWVGVYEALTSPYLRPPACWPFKTCTAPSLLLCLALVPPCAMRSLWPSGELVRLLRVELCYWKHPSNTPISHDVQMIGCALFGYPFPIAGHDWSSLA